MSSTPTSNGSSSLSNARTRKSSLRAAGRGARATLVRRDLRLGHEALLGALLPDEAPRVLCDARRRGCPCAGRRRRAGAPRVRAPARRRGASSSRTASSARSSVGADASRSNAACVATTSAVSAPTSAFAARAAASASASAPPRPCPARRALAGRRGCSRARRCVCADSDSRPRRRGRRPTPRRRPFRFREVAANLGRLHGLVQHRRVFLLRPSPSAARGGSARAPR